MSKTRSIPFFISIRLLLLFAAFILSYSFIVNHVYVWGMDEATEYYMFTEADIILDKYQSGEVIVEHQSGFREYYWPQNLPLHYQQQFPLFGQSMNVSLYDNHDDMVTYLLPVGSTADQQTPDLYVVHLLPDVDENDVSQIKIRQMLIFLGVATLVSLLLLIGWFVYRIVNATMALSEWAQQLNSDNHLTLLPPDKALYFTELKTVATKLATSFSELAKFNQREQQFLRSLSHELRTPIAVTGAALDILDKKAEDQGVIKLVAKIRRSSNTMRALTETILWLWRDPSGEPVNCTTKVKPIVDQSVQDNLHLLKSKTITVDNQIDEHMTLPVNQPLLTIISNNLIRNAFQYCDDGVVCITFDGRSLLVSNGFSNVDEQNLDINADYGFGLGLLIVQRIVDNNGWQLRVNKQGSIFCVEVDFSSI